jgi:zinc-ribbon domain
MIVCTGCGVQNADGATFCAECGAFLEWTGEAETEAAPVSAATEDRPVATKVPAAVLPAEAQRRRVRTAPPPVPQPVNAWSATLPAPKKQSWWRRLFRRRRKGGYAAGTRRRLRRPGRILKGLLALAVIAGIGMVATGPGRDLIGQAQQAIRDRLTDPAPVTPAAWEASSAMPDSGPELLSDRVTNQFWAPEGDPAGAWAEAELPEPIRLRHLVVTPGVSTEPAEFQEQGRPHELLVTTTAEDGTTTSTELVVLDQPGPQQFTLEADGVVRVRLEVVSTHGMADGRFMAISEVALFSLG